jgi:hypothetical protein
MDVHLKTLNHSLRENDMSKTQGKKSTREERKANFLAKLHNETLQSLKDEFLLRYMEDQCLALLEHLGDQMKKTCDAAPVRSTAERGEDPYCLSPVLTKERKALARLGREANGKWQKVKEDHLEFAIWQQFQDKKFVSCDAIQTFQMPLKDRNVDKKWGKVDLVGISSKNLPVVVELKKQDAKDTLHRMLIEALAYAIAVRKAWGDGGGALAKGWSEKRPHVKVPALKEVPIICAAPSEFWAPRLNCGKRVSNQVFKDARQPFLDLVEAISAQGFPVSFAQFDVDIETSGKLTIKNVEEIKSLWQ